MSILKFADAEILSVEVGQATAFTYKTAHKADFSHVERRGGYIYVRSRAISSRTNENHDYFSAPEIKKSWRTFIGKPVFVNHRNQNHRRARGGIVAAALHEDMNPDGSEDTWVEVYMEIDAQKYPTLAKAILTGRVNKTSMGCSVKLSRCSWCKKEARDQSEYCRCLKTMKGKTAERRNPDGTVERVKIIEECVGIGFFENSLLVEPPADPTAFILGVDPGPGVKVASKQAAQKCASCGHDATLHRSLWGCGGSHAQRPCTCIGFKTAKMAVARSKYAYGETRVPSQIDTLRVEACPECGETGSSWSGTECQVCGFKPTPKMYADPDLDVAGDFDREQEVGTDGEVPEGKAFPRTPYEAEPVSPAAATPQRMRGSKEARFMRGESFKVAVRQQKIIEAQARRLAVQNRRMARLEETVRFVCEVAGLKGHRRVASLFRRADVNNPAQPIPEPAPEAPAFTTNETEIPQATDHPENIGGTSGIPSPDANVQEDDPRNIGGSGTPEPDSNVEHQDPTKPVSGTTEPQDGTVEGDVTTPDPLGNKEVHEPITLSSARPMASLRLARLRIQAGMEDGEDLFLAEKIASSAMRDHEIEHEISILSKVAKRAASRQTSQRRDLVPRLATRTRPSLAPEGQGQGLQTTAAIDDEFMFEG